MLYIRRGPVSPEFYAKLRELVKDPWQPFFSLGYHACELGQFDGPSDSENLVVPYQSKIFIAPVAIVHYIAAHWCQPPECFREAVMACPSVRSMECNPAIAANGGRSLVRSPG